MSDLEICKIKYQGFQTQAKACNAFVSEDEKDSVRKPKYLGPEIENICAYRDSIEDKTNKKFVEHDPDKYDFCVKDNIFYAIHPALKKPQEVDMIMSLAASINEKLDERRKIQGENNEKEKKISEESKFELTILRGGITVILSGAIVFGIVTHSFELYRKQLILASEPLKEFIRELMKVDYGQDLIGAEEESARCSKFSEELNSIKRKKEVIILSPLVSLAAMLLISPLHESMTSSSNPQPKIVLKPADLALNFAAIAKDKELPIESELDAEPSIEKIKAIRIQKEEKLKKIKDDILYEKAREEYYSHLAKDSFWKTIFKWLIPIGAGAGTGLTFGNFVQGASFLNRLRLLRDVIDSAKINVKQEQIRKDYEDLKEEGRERARSDYRTLCKKEPPVVKSSTPVKVGLPIPGMESSVPSSSAVQSTFSVEPINFSINPYWKAQSTHPYAISGNDAIGHYHRKSFYAMALDFLNPIGMIIGITSTLPMGAQAPSSLSAVQVQAPVAR